MMTSHGEPDTLSILVADDHELIRTSVRELLETRPGWRVCGEATDGQHAVAQATHLQPDVAVIDMNMPILNGIAAARQIRSGSPGTELLLLTGYASTQLVADALDGGFRAVALKGHSSAELLSAVEAAGRHERFLSKGVLRELGVDDASPSSSPARVPHLTPREREVLELLAEGKTNWCVAAILSISVKTVETHRAKLYQKLGLESVTELVRYAIRNGVIAP
jgi:DNA-binding NarL/FixJ family response regulator